MQNHVIHSSVGAKRTQWIRIVASVAIAFVAQLAGCGGGGPTSNDIIYIQTQPASARVPLGETATFGVVASSGAPFSYQWTRNGVEIQGANSASYTTPAVQPTDSGTTYQVKISNRFNSVGSNEASLTVGARSPKAGDLRFQQVDAPSVSSGKNWAPGGVGTSVGLTYSNSVGSPLSIASGVYTCQPGVWNCAWGFSVAALPSGQTGLTMHYLGLGYAGFASDWQSRAAPNVVLTSLDFQPGSFAYAMGWIETTQPGNFDYRQEVVPPSGIQSTADQDAQQSRVITAASFDAKGQANLFSYGWTGDTTTVYDVKTILSGSQDIVTNIQLLASEGYILTAFGGNDTFGYVLVGTRVKGDTLPRDVIVSGRGSAPQSLDGYAPVAYFVQGTTGYYAFLFER